MLDIQDLWRSHRDAAPIAQLDSKRDRVRMRVENPARRDRYARFDLVRHADQFGPPFVEALTKLNDRIRRRGLLIGYVKLHVVGSGRTARGTAGSIAIAATAHDHE